MSGDERMEWLDDGVREKREEKSGQRLLDFGYEGASSGITGEVLGGRGPLGF